MHSKEIENVISLEPIERYKYFIKKVADWEVFFTLYNIPINKFTKKSP